MWFHSPNFESIEINRYRQASDHKPIASRIVIDKGVIKDLRSRIEKLPPEGQKMKSFASTVPLLNVDFVVGDRRETIQFYAGKIKTPATSFYAVENAAENELFSLVNRLLDDRSADPN